jgi:hypothetical protein
MDSRFGIRGSGGACLLPTAYCGGCGWGSIIIVFPAYAGISVFPSSMFVENLKEHSICEEVFASDELGKKERGIWDLQERAVLFCRRHLPMPISGSGDPS